MTPEDIKINDYNYPLPDDRIAKYPLAQRDRCKLLVRSRDGVISDHLFCDIPRLLPRDSILVYNNTRVINARIRMSKPSGAVIEIFCLEPVDPIDYNLSFAAEKECSWLCLVGNSKRWKHDDLTTQFTAPDGTTETLTAHRLSKSDNGSVIRFSWTGDYTFSEIISFVGQIPIPPYLNRDSEESDSADYQTVYAKIEGSVAAPTAGLHFTPELLSQVDNLGIQRRELTLHVGAGTFQPVKSETIGDHDMHSEIISVSHDLIAELASTDRKIVAVGTTSVRTLESLYQAGCMIHLGLTPDEIPQWFPYAENHPHLSKTEALTNVLKYLDDHKLSSFLAATRIIIVPGYRYKVVDAIITNFHQPQSTLLLLVSAFIGPDWLDMYRHALDSDYRFLSYGDSSLLL